MKKVIILIIGAIFVMSVVLISMFGMEMTSFNENTYAESVDFINLDITLETIDGKQIKMLRIPYTHDGMYYRLAWKITPDETTNKNVQFSLALNETDERVSVGNKGADIGIIQIHSYLKAFTVYITVQDGTNVRDELYIRLIRQS